MGAREITQIIQSRDLI